MKYALKSDIGKHALEEVTEGIYQQVGDYWKLMDKVCRWVVEAIEAEG